MAQAAPTGDPLASAATFGQHPRLPRSENPVARAAPILFAVALLCGGCAVTTANGERLAVGSDAFRGYVERVFREQNRIATDLAFALESEESSAERRRALASAERALLDACAGLNELAAARRDRERLGPVAEARAARSAPRCERAADAARRTLDRDAT